MKVFVVTNIDNEICKTFLSKTTAVKWCIDQCHYWAKNMGVDSKISHVGGMDQLHYIADKDGNEKEVCLPAISIRCTSGSEYTVTETVVDEQEPFFASASWGPAPDSLHSSYFTNGS